MSHALSPAGGSAPRPGLEARQHVRPGRCAGWGTPAADRTGPGPKPPRRSVHRTSSRFVKGCCPRSHCRLAGAGTAPFRERLPGVRDQQVTGGTSVLSGSRTCGLPWFARSRPAGLGLVADSEHELPGPRRLPLPHSAGAVSAPHPVNFSTSDGSLCPPVMAASTAGASELALRRKTALGGARHRPRPHWCLREGPSGNGA